MRSSFDWVQDHLTIAIHISSTADQASVLHLPACESEKCVALSSADTQPSIVMTPLDLLKYMRLPLANAAYQPFLIPNMPGIKRKRDSSAHKGLTSTTERCITRQMSTNGPRRAVCFTAELLEHILSFLPPKSIHGCVRVSRQFRDIVTTSVRLQRALGLRPAGVQKQLWQVVYDHHGTHSFKHADPASPPEYTVMPVRITLPTYTVFGAIQRGARTILHH